MVRRGHTIGSPPPQLSHGASDRLRTMNPQLGAYTVAMPWYSRDDFIRLAAIAQDRDSAPASYDDWKRQAEKVAAQYLANGKALQLVTVHIGELLAWLKERNLPNTTANRIRFVEAKVASPDQVDAMYRSGGAESHCASSAPW